MGNAGGYANDPSVTDAKFDFLPGLEYTELPFLAFQADGSFWLGDTGCYRALHFSPTRTVVDRISYVPTFYSAAVDPNSPTRVFANYLEYQIDYSLPLGPRNGSWKVVRNWRPGVPTAYDNMYGRMKYVTTLSNGRTYANLGGTLFELPPSGQLRNTGVAVPTTYSMYADGSLRSVSDSVMIRTWTQQSLLGFDGSNNPTWAEPVPLASVPLGPTDPIESPDPNRLRAGVLTAGGILASFDPFPAYGPVGHTGWHLAGIPVGDVGWSWKASASTPTNYYGSWPSDGTFDIGNGVGNAGGSVMALDHHVFYGYPGESWKSNQTNKFRDYYEDGLLVSEFGRTWTDVGRAEAAPELAGNAFNSWIVKSSDGRVFLYHNDESWHGGVHRWRLDGLDTVSEQSVPLTLEKDPLPGLHGDYFNTSDWNDTYRVSDRLDSQIDFSWGTSAPTGTAITSADAFSVRWTGYVVPQYSEAYTFSIQSEDVVTLWIDGQQIVPGVPVTLAAGTFYPIRLEYAHTSGIAGVSLGWSSPSQTTEVVPQSQLSFWPPGTDLMQGMVPGIPLVDGQLGWNRSPTTDANSDYWAIWTADVEENGGNPYMALGFRNSLESTSNEPVTDTVSRDLGDVSEATWRWDFDALVNYAGNYVNMEPCGGQYLDLRDDAGKVIAQFAPSMIAFPDDVRIIGNGTALFQSDINTINAAMAVWRPLHISAQAGTITFQYGSYDPVSTEVFDPAANWRRVKTAEIRFWTSQSWCGYDRKVSLDGMNLQTQQAPTNADLLLDNLVSAGSVTDGLDGWSRTPTADDTTDYWSTWSVQNQDDVDGREIDIVYRNNNAGATAEARRDLGTASDATARWELDMSLEYSGNFANVPPCAQEIEVLDDVDNVIAQFNVTQISFPDVSRVYGNNVTIYQDDVTSMDHTIGAWQPLQIVGLNGQVSFRYGSFPPVTAPPFLTAANWRRAKTLRISYTTPVSWCGYQVGVQIKGLQMSRENAGAVSRLLEGIPSNGSVANEYGWTTSSGGGLTVVTNRESWSTAAPDIDVTFQNSAVGATGELARDLGVPDDSTLFWELDGQINYDGNGLNNGTSGGQYLEILDDSGKMIAQFYPVSVAYPTDAEIQGNGTALFQSNIGDVSTMMGTWRPIRISAENGMVSFKYGDYGPVTTAVSDPTAQWQRPKVLKVAFWNGDPNTGYLRACSLADLTFTRQTP